MSSPADDFIEIDLEERLNGGSQQAESSSWGEAGKGALFGPLGTQEGRRHIARSASRVGETLAGIPGSIRDMFNMFAVGIPEYAYGEELPALREAVEQGTQGAASLFGYQTPSPENLRNITKQVSGGYTEPQNEIERISDDIVSDTAALVTPGKTGVSLARALGTSVFANSGAEVARAFYGDRAAASTKMGLLLAGSLATNGEGTKKYINKLYDRMRGEIPEGAEVSAKGLQSELRNIEARLRQGDPTVPSKQPALQTIQEIRNKISEGSISLEDAVAFNRDINERIIGLGELKRGQNQLYNIRNAMHETIKQGGELNPEFLKSWQSANEAFAATEQSRKIGSYIKKNISPKDYVYAASAVGLGNLALGVPGSATAGAMGVAGALGATVYSMEVLKRIADSPALREYYFNVAKTALKENKVGLARAMKQLNKGLEKSFEERPFEMITFEE